MAEYDYLVIGSGPGGYVSAIRASQLRLKTAVVERAQLGGVCLNWGCIPTKSLLQSAHLLESIKTGRLGIEVKGGVKPNIPEVVERSRGIASRLSNGIGLLFKKYKVELITGSASFIDDQTLKISDNPDISEVKAKKICIATGTRAREFDSLKFSDNVVSYKEAMVIKEPIENLLVIGAGAIGCEFSDYYANMGAKVTIVEVADQLLPHEEAETANELKSAFEKKKIKVWVSSIVESLEDKGSSVSAKIKRNDKIEELSFDKVLLAVGVTPNVEDLGLESIGVRLEKDYIPTNEFCQLNGHDNIYAIGDVIGGKQLAHKASREGMIAAEHAAGKDLIPLDTSNVPSCTYTSPQVASIGYKKAELDEKGIEYTIGKFPFNALGKALAAGEPRGFSQVYFDKESGEILGAHLVGHEVTELISNFGLSRAGELSVHEFLQTVFPHPTISESLHEAIGRALGESPNI